MKSKKERRDEFAMAALAGGLEQGVEHDHASLTPDFDNWWHSPNKIADRAYAIADAMMRKSLEGDVAEFVKMPESVQRMVVQMSVEGDEA